MLAQPYHDPSGDKMEHKIFRLIADKVRSDPSPLDVSVTSVGGRHAKGGDGRARFFAGRDLIVEARPWSASASKLLGVLRDDSEESRLFTGLELFPGDLDADEIDRCAWPSHQ